MHKRVLLFTQGYAGDLLREALTEHGILPVLYTYAADSVRRNSDKDYLREGYPCRYIHERAFDSSLIEVRSNDIIICLDWTKDFFHSSIHKGFSVPVYHIHPALLPLYRGYGAVSEQFLRGLAIGGVTLYRDNGHVDGGPIAYQQQIRIEHHHTANDYIQACVKIASAWVVELSGGDEPALREQNEPDAFYIQRRRHHMGQLDLNASALYVYNTIRAYSKPYFGAYFHHNGEKITVWGAKCDKWAGIQGAPGEIISRTFHGTEIACGEGSIILTEIEIDGTVYKFDEIPL